MNNLFLYFGLGVAKTKASDIDLPVRDFKDINPYSYAAYCKFVVVKSGQINRCLQ